MKRKEKTKIRFIKKAKIKSVVFKIIYTMIVLTSLYNIIFLINTTITNKEYLEIFGISFFSMNTDSMKKEISKKDLVITKEVNSNKLQVNDIIAYRINGKIRINKIINIYFDDESKKICYTTKSNQNYFPDIEKISEGQIIGKKIINVPVLGALLDVIQSRIFSLFVILFLCMLFYFNKYTYQMQRNRKRKKMNRKQM